MVMQYRLRGKTRWKDYPGKDKLDRPVSAFEWRLLNKDKSKVLWPSKSSGKDYSTYNDVLKNMRRIEYFKHNSSLHATLVNPPTVNIKTPKKLPRKKIYRNYRTSKKGGQHYYITKKRNRSSYDDEAAALYSENIRKKKQDIYEDDIGEEE